MALDLKNIHWKRSANTLLKVCLDFKILALISLNGMLIYCLAWDTFIRPSLENMKVVDKAIEEQRKALTEKQGLQRQFTSMREQLKELDTELVPVPAGNSSTVVSVTEYSKLLEIAKGKARDPKLPVLPAPHDAREGVEIKSVSNAKIDILNPTASSGAAPSAPAAAPAQQPANSTLPASSLPVEQYDYELKVSGTYQALMDVLNELVIRKQLVKITKVTISKPLTAVTQPDAKEFPDFPLKLDMVINLSIFLYDAPEQPAAT